MANMKDFLLKLEDDDDLRKRFRQSPQEVAQAEGLTTEQAAALASNNPKQIRRELEAEVGEEAVFGRDGGEHPRRNTLRTRPCDGRV